MSLSAFPPFPRREVSGLIVSNRQRRVLEVLLQRKEATANDIADEVQISARTVHRDIQELKLLLADYGLSLVTKSGKGISIQGTDEALKQFHTVLGHFETVAYASEERKTLISCQLLESFEPIKLFSLAYEMHTAIPTVTRDLDELEPLLNKHGLELIRKRGYGVEIKGSEAAKRALIEWLAIQYLDESDLFGATPVSSHIWPVSKRLLQIAGIEKLLKIEQILWKLEEKWPSRLAELDYTRLLLRLSIAISRMEAKHWLTDSTNGRRWNNGSTSNSSKVEEVDELPDEIQLFLTTFPWNWPLAEKTALRELLREAMTAAVKQDEDWLSRNQAAASKAAERLIQSASGKLGLPLEQDASLLEGLVNHLGPALERLSRGEDIRNPLLAQIKKDFSELFTMVRDAANEVLKDWIIPDEEIGYLVMHFGASMERLHAVLKVIIVCTSGIGSSKLLAARIAKQFPQITVIGNYSWYEASRLPKDHYDIIISTVDLPIDAARYIKISPLLTSEDSERLMQLITQLPLAAANPQETIKSADTDGWERMKQMNAYTSAVVQVLEPFEVYPLILKQDGALSEIERVLAALLQPLSATLGPEGTRAITDKLLERERLGSQALTGTELALFHTRSDYIDTPILKLYRLEHPLWLGEQREHKVHQILLMLAPLQLARPVLDILSEISAMLLQTEFEALLKEGHSGDIKLYISQELETYIQSKWRGREQ